MTAYNSGCLLRGNKTPCSLLPSRLSLSHRLTMTLETLSTDLKDKATISQTEAQDQEDQVEQPTATGSTGAKKNKKKKKPAAATGEKWLT